MLFTTTQFLLFLPIMLLLYFLIPVKMRRVTILAASIFFYANFGLTMLAVLLTVTLLSYGVGLSIEKRGSRAMLTCGVLASAGLLAFYKYAAFLSAVFGNAFGFSGEDFSLVMPVGISYFTFRIISYFADVYKGKCEAEKNFLNYAVYVTFFPMIISGPIERAERFLGQIKACESWNLWNSDRVYDGFVRVVFGFIQKLVIADRLSILVGTVYDDFAAKDGALLWIAMAAYYLQLYMDFAGYTNIALGAAKMMGFDLCENFRNPFLARNVKEYWSRWHISLSTWLRDYIYIPLGGNRGGTIRKYRNIMLTFLLSGLWHGNGWRYLLWGGAHGACQVIEYVVSSVAANLGCVKTIDFETGFWNLIRRIKTWIIVGILYIFFRIPSAREGLMYIRLMFTNVHAGALTGDTAELLGVTAPYLVVVTVLTVLVLFAEYQAETKSVTLGEGLRSMCLPVRFAILLVMILAVALFGAYGPGYDATDFIYFGF
ncbi:MAG: MBOAT family protein [Lachnospiraceae bacterium]|nr:MBOAT family protein [Lachnospiraceae bacterium]